MSEDNASPESCLKKNKKNTNVWCGCLKNHGGSDFICDPCIAKKDTEKRITNCLENLMWNYKHKPNELYDDMPKCIEKFRKGEYE